MDKVKEATTDEEILACFEIYKILIPCLKYEEFLDRIHRQQQEGFRIAYIQDPDNLKTRSLVGFRTANYLYSGKTLYVDDVITAPEARGKGYAGILQNWIKQYAADNDYNGIRLDSSYTRNDAHRLYLKSGFHLDCHHLTIHLKDH